MAAERRRAAALDRRHHLQLARLTWPALARRHAGPWSRKMSATSSAGRDKCCASGWRLGLRQRDAVERAHDLLDRLGGDARVERRGVELGMTEQDLDHPDIDVLFQQVCGEAVPQRMHGYRLAVVPASTRRAAVRADAETALRTGLCGLAHTLGLMFFCPTRSSFSRGPNEDARRLAVIYATGTSVNGTLKTCSPILRMPVDRGRPEVAGRGSNRRF